MMHDLDGLSRSEIARRTGLSRTTVKKWLRAQEGALRRYRRESMPGKPGPCQATLTQALETDALRPKRDRRTAKALFAELQSAGCSGGYTVLTDLIRHWRAQAGANAPTRAFVLVAYPGQGHEMLFDAHTRSFAAMCSD